MSAAVKQRSKILLLGDSLTQTSFEGWGGGLAHQYQRRADVINRGMSGYNTRWYLKYAKDYGVWNEQHEGVKIELIAIFFGANDASLEDQNPHAYVPLDEYKSNLKQLASLCRKHYPQAKILFITPPPVHHAQRLEFQKRRYKEKATGVLERTLENTGKYASACQEVAKELAEKDDNGDDAASIACLDLYNQMKDANDGDFGKFFYDGLHFSKDGHAFVVKSLLEKIGQELSAIAVKPDPITGQENNSGSSCDGISSSGPYHDHIDHTCWEKSFANDDDGICEEGPFSKKTKIGD